MRMHAYIRAHACLRELGLLWPLAVQVLANMLLVRQGSEEKLHLGLGIGGARHGIAPHLATVCTQIVWIYTLCID